MPLDSADEALAEPLLQEAIRRGVISIDGTRITYNLKQQKRDDWTDAEEWVRACTVAWLVIDREYPPNRIKVEVNVPRRTPNDWADIVVYKNDACTDPYLVVENKAENQTAAQRAQGIEQAYGNANSLRAPFCLYDEGTVNVLFDVLNFPAGERESNRLGARTVLPKQYGAAPEYTHIAGDPTNDIQPVGAAVLSAKVRRAHSIIWAGGKRDPLTAFDEWSKMLFAKVQDERTTPSGSPRRLQVGTKETTTAVANRAHTLFHDACIADPDIFGSGARITLPDAKIVDVVRVLQDVAFTRTDADTIGQAFEQFFGSIFRGELGQYFTMRQLARFIVGVVELTQDDLVLDPTAGSGGFLLEGLLQAWHRIDREFAGQPAETISRLKYDFAHNQVYGVEIHDVLARICKINLLLHHDGHTNIEAGRSCLDEYGNFAKPRLQGPGRFTAIVGNPPFGDDVEEGDDDKLGTNDLSNFVVAAARTKVDSEHVIVERCVDYLQPGGQLGLVLPDGLLNNQGEQSNCPRVRRFLASNGFIEAIVSLPDHAFRPSGAQNKTSILFFRKFTPQQSRTFGRAHAAARQAGADESEAVARALEHADLAYFTFLAEANQIGYSPTGIPIPVNELYRQTTTGGLAGDQGGTILGEWRLFRANPSTYQGNSLPDCMAVRFPALWRSHGSHRLDPKYHLFQREAHRPLPTGWIRLPIRQVMRRRSVGVKPELNPDQEFAVMTISQTGEIRSREEGKGKAPPEWRGGYFADMPSKWFAASGGDLVYSSIDLWKGCIALVPAEFDGALVTKEFPIYEVVDTRLRPAFLQTLLRSRYYQRAFRAITTGHSNRRRTQQEDFEALEIAFPADPAEQDRLITEMLETRGVLQTASDALQQHLKEFSDLIDGRGDEELPEIDAEPVEQ